MIHQTVGHFKILEQIGSGGMGAVYKAQDQKLNRLVAIKVLPDEMASHLERLQRFKREAQAIASLNHPNIVTLFAVEEFEDNAFIVMELVEGQNLNRFITRSGQLMEEFFQFAIPITDALATAHSNGITHRDLKPSNVMIDKERRVKVIDFGLAKIAPDLDTRPNLAMDTEVSTESLTVEGRVLGSPSYMAPEQVEGKTVDHRSDIFTMGILFHEMLTGTRPFQGDTNMSIMSSILKDQPSSISDIRKDVPSEISRVIRRCLYKNPTERIQSALDLRNELKELQREYLSGSLTSISSVSRPGKKDNSSSTKWIIGFAATIILLGLVAGLLKWMPRDRSKSAKYDSGSKVESTDSISVPKGFPTIKRLTVTSQLEEMPTWSPKGDQMAFVGIADNHRHIFIRNISTGETRQLTTDDYDHIHPCWGPDDNSIYYSRGLKRGEFLGISDTLGGYYPDRNTVIVRQNFNTGESKIILESAGYPNVAASGNLLVFTRNYRIWKSDLNGHHTIQMTTDDGIVAHTEPSISRSGENIVYRRTNPRGRIDHIALVTMDHRESVLVDKGWNLHPTWHPSGEYVYFAHYGGAGMNIFRIKVDRDTLESVGIIQPVTLGGGYDLQPAFSPDGKNLLFRVASLNADIYRISMNPKTGKTNGTPPEPMPFNSPREDSRASWAPTTDDEMIAFNSDRHGDMNLFIWRGSDDSITQVTQGPGGDFQAHWSPDFQNLVFFSARNGNSDIFTVSTNAFSNPNALTKSPSSDYNPFYSPDGKHIIFASNRDGGSELYVMKADGTDQRILIRNSSTGHFMTWQDSQTVFNRMRVDGVMKFYRIFLDGREPEPVKTISPLPNIGGHGSFSPDQKFFMDLNGPHTHIWTLELGTESGSAIYNSQAGVTLDYPVWSPGGNWATFDYAKPGTSEILMASWVETDE